MNSAQPALRIVGIGASAGGLQALESFFKDIPLDSGVTFVIIQHLSPDHKTMMPSLLGRVTDIPVNLAEDGMPLEKDHIYLIPAKKNIVLKDDTLQYINRAPINKLNLSIDIFFNSLANEKKEKAVGVILTGTGSDGTKGGQNIKEVGGTIFVQNPSNIRFTGMPNSAISAGIADYIKDINELPNEILDYIDIIHNKFQTLHEEDKESIEDILELLKVKSGNDFTSYRRQTLNRRLIKRMNLSKVDSIHDYKLLLDSNPEEQTQLANEFLIGVTEFFRDNQYFRILEKTVIPSICNKNNKGDIKAWSIACSTGEEAYSIAILISEFLETHNITNNFKVFATDIDEEALEVASKGVYNERIISDVKPEFLSKYFIRKNNSYIVQPFLRKHIIFSLHNILSNPPFSKMDLISCRNMLIYLKPEAQKRVFRNIAYALNVEGFLFLGGSESANILSNHIKPIHKKARIFQKEKDYAENAEAFAIDNKKYHNLSRNMRADSEIKLADVSIKALSKLTDSICIVYDTAFDIIKLFGDFNKIATFPKDGFDLKVLKLNRLLPQEFNVPITSSMSTLKNDFETTIKKTIVYNKEGNSHMATFSLNHLKTKRGTLDDFFLLVINGLEQKWESSKDKQNIVSNTNQEDLILIEQMLNDTRENLQLTIEELEASNEEAQATNEELVSSNEELQSTNEELQSVNEELNTVNVELEERNVQLLDLNADFENLINSSGAVNLFLDKELNVRNYTQSILPIFSFLETDIGRNLNNFSLPYPELIDDIQEVIKSLHSFEKEISLKSSDNEKCYLQSIHPYRTTNDEIKGVVINYSDISSIKTTHRLLNNLMKTTPGVVYIYNLQEHKNEYTNPRSNDLAGYTTKELGEMGDDMIKKLIHPDDASRLMAHYERMKESTNDEVQTCEYRLIKKGRTINSGDYAWFMSYDLPFERNERNEVTKICGVGHEISELKNALFKLEEKNKLLSQVTSISPVHTIITEAKSNIIRFTSSQLLKNLGFTETVIEGETTIEHLLGIIMKQDDYMPLTVLWGKIIDLNVKGSYQLERIAYNNKGDIKWFMWNSMPYEWTQEGNIKSIIHFTQDITELKENQLKLETVNKELEEFTYLSSHDLQQPLNTIQSSLQIVNNELKGEQSEIVQRCLNIMKDTTESMKLNIKSILDYSKVKSDVSFHTVKLNEILTTVLTSLSSMIERLGAVIEHDEELPTIKGDSHLVGLVFQNLITNAIKFQKKGNIPKIEIRYKRSSTHEIINFIDNGIGISEKQQSRIFTLFQRLHESEYEGTGIGLAHANKIMRLHSGKIEIDSRPDEGSTFKCYFLRGK